MLIVVIAVNVLMLALFEQGIKPIRFVNSGLLRITPIRIPISRMSNGGCGSADSGHFPSVEPIETIPRYFIMSWQPLDRDPLQLLFCFPPSDGPWA